MRPTERKFFLESIRPYLRVGERIGESGTALIFRGESGPDDDGTWYLDCPSYLGSTERREIGRMEQAPGWRLGLVCWTEKTKRFLGKGWEARMLAEFLKLTGLDKRTPCVQQEPVSRPCPTCGHWKEPLRETLIPCDTCGGVRNMFSVGCLHPCSGGLVPPIITEENLRTPVSLESNS